MTAVIRQCPPIPESDRIRCMVVCDDCSIEWGWGAGDAVLAAMRDLHNSNHHAQPKSEDQ